MCAEQHPAALQLLALGDSYTIGESVDPADRWPMQLVEALRAAGVVMDPPKVIAATGWSTDELSAAIDAAEPLGHQYALVSLLIGVNNQYRGRAVDDYAQAFAILLERAIGFADRRADRVFVLAIPDWSVTPFAAQSGRDIQAISRELDAYNAAAARLCIERGVAFVDIAPVSRARGAEAAMLAEDGLHPSAAMYAEWTRLALPVVRRLLAEASAHRDTGTINVSATQPFDSESARAIAEAFLPRFPLGNRYDYYYVRAKLSSDPLYPGVLAALRGSDAPLLDLGCGLGLLAHALRFDGQTLAYRGVDNDVAKIARAQRIADKSGFTQTQFEVIDLASVTPSHRGSVAILDVLQYLDADAQRALLAKVAAMLTPDALLVMRSAIDDETRRARTSRITDRLANWVGWMQFRPRSYPTLAGLRDALEAAGLQAEFTPLYGNTPFNNWLIVARRT